eukprot:7971955-Pyramimonas_sp.AAC.1
MSPSGTAYIPGLWYRHDANRPPQTVGFAEHRRREQALLQVRIPQDWCRRAQLPWFNVFYDQAMAKHHAQLKNEIW